MTNGARTLEGETGVRVRGLLNAHANCSEPPSDPDLLRYFADRRESVLALSLEHLSRESAEINGLAAIYGRDPNRLASSRDFHYLVATDTGIGQEAASLVATCMRRLGLNVVTTLVPAGLRTDDRLGFRGGVSVLMRHLADICGDRESRAVPVVFHLSGAFKSIVGAMVAAGMIYADEICMLFESSSDLMVIPRLPFDLEASVLSDLRARPEAVRRLGNGETLPLDACARVPEALYIADDGQAIISEWGELIWERARQKLYREGLWPSPSELVTFGTAFERSVSRLTEEEYYGLNKTVDELVRHMAARRAGQTYNPRSLRVHPVRSHPDWHEAYPGWDTADRLYFRYQGGPEVLVLEHLGDHL